jgi:broad specificity phosphatase PhoE
MATVVKPLAAHESLSKSHDPQEAVEAARVLVDVDSIHTEDSSEETTPGTTEGERGKEANESHAGEMSTNSPPEAKHKTPTDKAGGRTVRREFARMGRRMARALERLEDNLDDESSKGISKNVQGGLNALRDLISTLK